MRYEPWAHTGSIEQIIQGLLEEAMEILHSGILRMHAQDREIERIYWTLKEKYGALLMGSTKPEK